MPRAGFLLVIALSMAACGSRSTRPNPAPQTQFLPTASGPCPIFTPGHNTFAPDGHPRDVLIWGGERPRSKVGPLVLYWHGSGSDPSQALRGLPVDAIVAAGGIVAAPYHDPANTIVPWYLSGGGTNDADVRVADEVLACAMASVGVDTRHIHSVGFSAGAMHNTQFVAMRSGYLASIVNYSGARIGNPDEQDPSNKYPAMLFEGGPTDQVVISLQQYTTDYHDALTTEGHFSFICDHNLGHKIPPAVHRQRGSSCRTTRSRWRRNLTRRRCPSGSRRTAGCSDFTRRSPVARPSRVAAPRDASRSRLRARESDLLRFESG